MRKQLNLNQQCMNKLRNEIFAFQGRRQLSDLSFLDLLRYDMLFRVSLVMRDMLKQHKELRWDIEDSSFEL